MWSTVELREIRVFLTVADELHFGRAAERLALTPSRVSQTIRTLEARVGGRLFDRTSRRVRLTPLGDQFLRRVGPAFQHMQRAFEETREIATGVTGDLRLGMYTPVNGGPHLTEIIKTFETRHPESRVVVTDTSARRDQFAWLRRDEVDLLAIRLPVSEPEVTIGPLLSRESRVVAVAADHPLAARGSVGLNELAHYKLSEVPTLPIGLKETFLPAQAPSGRKLRRTVVQSLPEAIMRVATGEIVHATVPSFIDHYYRHPGVVAIPIRDMPPSETALVWLTSNDGVKLQAFARAAADVLQAHAGAADRDAELPSPPVNAAGATGDA
jgi:DNA-binding transcriptional LysR family regulator